MPRLRPQRTPAALHRRQRPTPGLLSRRSDRRGGGRRHRLRRLDRLRGNAAAGRSNSAASWHPAGRRRRRRTASDRTNTPQTATNLGSVTAQEDLPRSDSESRATATSGSSSRPTPPASCSVSRHRQRLGGARQPPGRGRRRRHQHRYVLTRRPARTTTDRRHPGADHRSSELEVPSVSGPFLPDPRLHGPHNGHLPAHRRRPDRRPGNAGRGLALRLGEQRRRERLSAGRRRPGHTRRQPHFPGAHRRRRPEPVDPRRGRSNGAGRRSSARRRSRRLRGRQHRGDAGRGRLHGGVGGQPQRRVRRLPPRLHQFRPVRGERSANAVFARAGFADLIVADDLNGDGNPDLLTTNTTTSDTVSVLLSNGDGALQARSRSADGPGPVQRAPAPGNRQPVVSPTSTATASPTSPCRTPDRHGLGADRRNGGGTFQPPSIFNGVPNGDSMVAGDFTGDGKLDLVVLQNFRRPAAAASRSSPTSRVAGDGTFLLCRRSSTRPSLHADAQLDGHGLFHQRQPSRSGHHQQEVEIVPWPSFSWATATAPSPATAV